jgi:virulence-associated protein VagC
MATDDLKIELTIDGDKVIIEPLDVTGEEWRVIKQATGMTTKQVMEGVSELDLDAVAGLAWNTIRKTDRDATFVSVLSKLTLRAIIEAADAVEDSGDLDPSV